MDCDLSAARRGDRPRGRTRREDHGWQGEEDLQEGDPVPERGVRAAPEADGPARGQPRTRTGPAQVRRALRQGDDPAQRRARDQVRPGRQRHARARRARNGQVACGAHMDREPSPRQRDRGRAQTQPEAQAGAKTRIQARSEAPAQAEGPTEGRSRTGSPCSEVRGQVSARAPVRHRPAKSRRPAATERRRLDQAQQEGHPRPTQGLLRGTQAQQAAGALQALRRQGHLPRRKRVRRVQRERGAGQPALLPQGLLERLLAAAARFGRGARRAYRVPRPRPPESREPRDCSSASAAPGSSSIRRPTRNSSRHRETRTAGTCAPERFVRAASRGAMRAPCGSSLAHPPFGRVDRDPARRRTSGG